MTVAVIAAIVLPGVAVFAVPVVIIAGIRGGRQSAARGAAALLILAAVGFIAAGIVGTAAPPGVWMRD